MEDGCRLHTPADRDTDYGTVMASSPYPLRILPVSSLHFPYISLISLLYQSPKIRYQLVRNSLPTRNLRK